MYHHRMLGERNAYMENARKLYVLVVLLVGVVCLLDFSSSAVAAETGSITGKVTLQAGGPKLDIGTVDVCAYTSAEKTADCANPGGDGEYTIEGLAAGEYKVGFWSTGYGYLSQFFDDRASLSEAEPVQVTAGQTTSGIDAELRVAGKVTGRVTNAATGEPIQGVQVCATPTVPGDCERTNANGEYTISELAGGEYTLEFTPIGELDYFYAQTGVSVTAGQVTSGVDVGLTEGGRITGRVTSASTGEPIEGAEACAREARDDEKQCATTNTAGEYSILRLNGRYTVEVHIPGDVQVPGGGDYLAQFYGGEPPFENGRLVFSPSQELSVAAPGTVSGIDVVLQPGVFEEPVSTAPPVVSGTAVVGDALSCSSGSWGGDPAPRAFAYTWLRDGASISGADGSSYTAQSADEGHSVSCKVSAANSAGSQIGTGQAVSPSVTIAPGSTAGSPPGGSGGSAPPAQTMAGTLGSTPLLQATPLVILMTSRITVSGDAASVNVSCSRVACRGSIELTTQVRTLGKGDAAASRRATLVLATGSFSVAEGKSRTVVLRLTTVGRKMLAHANRHHPITATLVLSVKGVKATTKAVLAI